MKPTRYLAALVLAACAACGHPRHAPAVEALSVAKIVATLDSAPTTVPTPPPEQHSSRPRASRQQVIPVTPATYVAPDEEFFDRLAMCESHNSNEAGGGYWQIIDSTWHQAGERGRATDYSREYQFVVAKRWAARIHPREATTAGWPNCWRIALRQ